MMGVETLFPAPYSVHLFHLTGAPPCDGTISHHEQGPHGVAHRWPDHRSPSVLEEEEGPAPPPPDLITGKRLTSIYYDLLESMMLTSFFLLRKISLKYR